MRDGISPAQLIDEPYQIFTDILDHLFQSPRGSARADFIVGHYAPTEESEGASLMNKKFSMVDVCMEISARPGMYIGSKSITKLFHFLNGVEFAVRGFDPEWSDPAYDGFQEWTQRRFDVKISQNWANIILFHSTDESTAFDYFLELLGEYLVETGKHPEE